MSKPSILIVGGGITGLSAAFRLENLMARSGKQATIHLIDAAHRTGGKLVSEQIQGFIVDAGPDIFMAGKSGVVQLCTELGITDRIIPTNPAHRKTYVREKDSFVLKQITMYDGEPLATLKGGIQDLVDATRSALSQTQITLGAEVTSISVTDGGWYRALITRNASPSTPESNHGEAINLSSSSQHPHLLKHNTEGTDSSPYELEFDAVIVTTPAKNTAAILSNILPNSDRYFTEVSYTKTTTVSAGFRSEDVVNKLDGYGYIIKDPSNEGGISACTWSSSKIAGRAPEGYVLLRAFVRGNPENDESIYKSVLEEFRNVLGVTNDPLFIKAYRWPEAVPIYGEVHSQNIAELDLALEPYPNIVVTGSAVQGSGIPDSISGAFTAADVIWSQTVENLKSIRPIHKSDASYAKHFARK